MERIEDNQENQDEANYKNNFRTRGRPRVEQQTLNTVKDILKLVKGIESLFVKLNIFCRRLKMTFMHEKSKNCKDYLVKNANA